MSVILQGYIEVPKGEAVTPGKLIPVEITLVSKKHHKQNRNRRILAMKREDPSLSCEAIATLVGVTRQRVHQILKADGVTCKRRHRKPQPRITPLSEFEEM